MYDDIVALLYNFLNQIYSLSPLSSVPLFHSQLSLSSSLFCSPLFPLYTDHHLLFLSLMPLSMTHFLITSSLMAVVALVSWWVCLRLRIVVLGYG